MNDEQRRVGRALRGAGFILTAAWIGWHGPSSASAQPVAVDQRDAELTYLQDRGEFLLFWSEDRGGGSRIYARRVSENGTPVGGATLGEWEATREGPQGSLVGVGEQRWPSAIPGMLIYSERRPDATDFDIYGQRLFDNGRPSGLPMLITGGPGNQVFPSVISADRGRGQEFMIVYSEDVRDAGDIMGIRVDYALRRSRGPAFPVAQGPGNAEDPTIAPDPAGGGYLVMFTDDRAGNKDIYGTRLVESGLPRGGPTVGHFPVVDVPDDDFTPRVVLGEDRSNARRVQDVYLLLWTRLHLTDAENVLAQRLSNNGLPIGRPTAIAAGPGLQAWPAAAARHLPEERRGPRDTTDDFLTAWLVDAAGTLDVLGTRVGLYGTARNRHVPLAVD
jgi:hypothetical protein